MVSLHLTLLVKTSIPTCTTTLHVHLKLSKQSLQTFCFHFHEARPSVTYRVPMQVVKLRCLLGSATCDCGLCKFQAFCAAENCVGSSGPRAVFAILRCIPFVRHSRGINAPHLRMTAQLIAQSLQLGHGVIEQVAVVPHRRPKVYKPARLAGEKFIPYLAGQSPRCRSLGRTGPHKTQPDRRDPEHTSTHGIWLAQESSRQPLLGQHAAQTIGQISSRWPSFMSPTRRLGEEKWVKSAIRSHRAMPFSGRFLRRIVMFILL